MPTCPHCSTPIPDASRFCPSCGRSLSNDPDVTISAAGVGNGADAPPQPADPSSSGSDTSMHGRFVPGTKLAGRYRIVALLGRGGMGEVYRADDLKLGQPVALKFLPKLGADEKRLALFHNEVRLSRQVSHPNVCRVYDIGEADGQPFISMEYIDGEDLKGLLQRIGRLPKDKGVQIAQQLCAGLAAAHDKGVLHRDLKPANIMIDGRGHVRITDFGLAAIADDAAETHKLAGTPAYMAPEQLAQGVTTIQSDLYSLGLILYEVFTGQKVHKGASIPELRREHEESSPMHPSTVVDDIDSAVERVIVRCLQKQPHERPKSARAVAAALPGGDPLAAALAAGETPSPDMIAAAGDTGMLSLKAGATLFAAVCLGLIAIPLVANWLDALQLSRFAENKPAVLEHDAREWIKALGYETPPADSVFGFMKDPVKNDQKQIVGVNLQYWYRQHTATLDPYVSVFRGGPVNWRVTPVNPPPILPGMVSVRLDAAARFDSGRQLLEFLAVPEDGAAAGAAATATPDWDGILRSCGLDPERFKTEAPAADLLDNWRPPIDADFVTIRQDASTEPASQVILATRSGRPVYFRRIGRDSTSVMGAMTKAEAKRFSQWSFVRILTIVFAGVLALRNVRMGRSDTRGATRLSLYYFAILMLLWPVTFHHVLEPARELGLGAEHLGRALAHTVRLWLGYVALEPYVRRLWPVVLIAWSRVLDGRLRDALVGRDLLIGCLFAVVITIIVLLAGSRGYGVGADSIIGGRFVLASVLNAHQGSLGFGIIVLALLLFFRLVLRSTWMAALLVAAMNAALVAVRYGSPLEAWNIWLLNAMWAGIWIVLFLRYGLLCAIAGQSLLMVLISVPHTADLGAWYAQAGTTALAVTLLVAAYGFYTSTLAGRRPVDLLATG